MTRWLVPAERVAESMRLWRKRRHVLRGRLVITEWHEGLAKLATGFHGQVAGPVMFCAGEKGLERVDITPGKGI